MIGSCTNKPAVLENMEAPVDGRNSQGKLRLGIVGLGKMGLLHWQTLQRFRDVNLTAVVDTNPEVAMWANQHAVPFFRSPADLIGRVGAAVIATPPGQHFSNALPLLRAGIHCLVEKPIAIDVADAERLVATAARHGALLAIGHSERFNPGVQQVRDLAAAGLKRMEVFRMAPLRPSCMSDADVVQDLMVHDLDWVIDLMRQMPSAFRVLDARRLGGCLAHVCCELSFADGVQIVLVASRLETVGRREVFMHGGDGKSHVIDLTVESDSPASDPLTLQARAFLHALEGKASTIATGTEALLVTQLGDSIRACCEEVDAFSL